MPTDFARGLFALLCLLCVVAIITGAWLELARTRRGDSLLAPRHFRLRLFSALIWIISLLSLAGALTRWWPEANATINQKWQFVAIINGVFCLVLFGLALLGLDMWMLITARRKVEREHSIRFSEQLRDLAEQETARLRGAHASEEAPLSSSSKKVRAYAPKEGSENVLTDGGNLDQF